MRGDQSVLLVWRAPNDQPAGEVVAAAAAAMGWSFATLEWDQQTAGVTGARKIRLGRRRPGHEPVGVMVPRRGFLTAALRADQTVVVTKDIGPMTGLANLGRLRHRHRHTVALVEQHPRFSGAAVHVRWKRPVRRLFVRGLGAVVANTAEAAAWLRDDLRVPADRVIEGWWLAGMPPTPYSPPPAHDGLRLGFVGSLDARKQPQVVAAVVQHLRAAGTAASATVIGDGPLKVRGEAVELLGRVPRAEVAALLAGFDLLLAPSLEDQTNRAVVEAISVGCPAMVPASIGTAGTLVVDGVNGIVMPDTDPVAWAERLAALSAADLERLRRGAVASAAGLSTAACAEPVRRAIERALR